jgi:integrase
MNVVNFIELNKEHSLQLQVDQALDEGSKIRIKLAKGLTLKVNGKQKAEFVFRSQKNGIRSQIKLGVYKRETSMDEISHGLIDVKNAMTIVEKLQDKAERGLHPVKELRSVKYSVGTTFEAIYQKVLANKKLVVKSTAAFERHYEKEIKSFLGCYSIHQITQDDVQIAINEILISGRKTVAEKSLYLCKAIFNYAAANNIGFNVTQKMTVKNNAGGISPLKGIALAEHDLKRVFKQMRELRHTFSESLYLFCILLVSFGLRKSELLTCKWSYFDQENSILHIERDVAKNKVSIAIPVSGFLQPLFNRLKILADDSEFIFPTSKKSKSGHMCSNTPNSALKRLFSKIHEPDDSEYCQIFTIHDLRRTFRTMLSRMKVDNTVAELCINHRETTSDSTINIVDRYDRYVRLEERKAAHDLIAKKIIELAEEDKQIQLKLVA